MNDQYNYSIHDFDSLQRVKYNYQSNKNQVLTGYLYSYKNDDEYSEIIILVHGLGGGGHNPYMECIDYFVKNNYLVFGYDATGNGEREGKITAFPNK